MLSRYFGFNEDPFGATPDPRCLYSSPTHQEALASLMYGFYSNRGFTALIAPPGLGKTTLLLRFLDDIHTSARTVFLFDALCEPLELISYMLRDLGIVPGRNGVELREQLKEVLVSEARAGRRFVVVIDEAQNMSDDALEMVRQLTNFETPRAKLMQIVLSGQPRLSDKLMLPSLEQLRQRISTFCRLEPLSAEQTAAYIDHRLKRAGYVGPPLFTEDALRLLTEASRGIPRTINNLCFNALSLSCALRRKQVDVGIASEAIADQSLSPLSSETVAVSISSKTALRVEPQQRKRSIGLTKAWVAAAAVLIVGSTLGALASPNLKPLWSRITFGTSSLFEKVLSSSLNVSAASNTIVAEPTPKTMPFEITVGPHQSLEQIAVQYLGGFDKMRLRQIQLLNPKIKDPSHIESGQRLWLPGRTVVPVARSTTSSADAAILHSTHSSIVEASTGTAIGNHLNANTASFEVTVVPDQTLQDVCIQHLGNFDLQRLHQVEALNPRLTDPDHIVAGQKLWLPKPTVEPTAENGTSVASARTSHEP
jgi:general secretion pathway protein A